MTQHLVGAIDVAVEAERNRVIDVAKEIVRREWPFGFKYQAAIDALETLRQSKASSEGG